MCLLRMGDGEGGGNYICWYEWGALGRLLLVLVTASIATPPQQPIA